MNPGTIQKKIEHGHKPHVFHGHVKSWDRMIFVVEKARGKPSEMDMVIHFGRPVHYQVIKLGTEHLPHKDQQGRSIRWIGNFGVVNDSGSYVRKVKYSLLLPALRKNQVYVYYENGELKECARPADPLSMVEIQLTSGDPPVGIRPKDGTEPIIVDPSG